jgi:hypothetical protein
MQSPLPSGCYLDVSRNFAYKNSVNSIVSHQLALREKGVDRLGEAKESVGSAARINAEIN